MIAGVFVVLLLSAATAHAQVEGGAYAEGEVNTGGGLGDGISHMVRSILGETNENESEDSRAGDARMQKTIDAAPVMMMQADLSATAALSVTTEVSADVPVHLRSLRERDQNIQTIEATETRVRLSYTTDAYIFRLVPVTMRVRAEVSSSGEARISYPWYAFAVRGISADFESHFAARMAPYLDGEPFASEEQIILADEIYAALATEFDAAQE